MGMNSGQAMDGLAPLVFDLESCPIEDVRAYVDPPDLENITAPKSYKSEEAITAYIENAKAERIDAYETAVKHKAALDWNTARIVALGWSTVDEELVSVTAARNGDEERAALTAFWALARRRPLVGFGIRAFDLPMLIQRSRYLGVAYPEIDLGRYAKFSTVIDLFDLLTFNDARCTSVMKRSLRSFCRRFGIEVNDETDGADIPALVLFGAWDTVRDHCCADVMATKELAIRIGAISSVWTPKPVPLTTAEMVRELRVRKQPDVL